MIYYERPTTKKKEEIVNEFSIYYDVLAVIERMISMHFLSNKPSNKEKWVYGRTFVISITNVL